MVKCGARAALAWGVVEFLAWEPDGPLFKSQLYFLLNQDAGVGVGGLFFFTLCLSFLVCKAEVTEAPPLGFLTKMRFGALLKGEHAQQHR